MRLTESNLLFLARFAKLPEGKEFLELMRAKLDETDAKLRITDGPELHRQQGRAQELDDWIAALTESQRKLTMAQSAHRPRSVVNTNGFAP
jgi:hypothetical protein